jgi:MSHA pilin protein MshA
MKIKMMIQRKISGFTLIELVIVVVILGVLALVVAKQFGSSVSNSAKANSLYVSADKLITNWVLLTTSAGTSSIVAGSQIPTSGSDAMDVLIGGQPNVAAAYKPVWTQTGLTPLTDLVQGSSGAYTIMGYGTSMSGGSGVLPVKIIFNGVPDEVVLLLVKKYGSNVSTLSGLGDTTNPVIQYGVPSAGSRSITVQKN